MTRDDMNTLLHSYLSVYHNEQNDSCATRAQVGRTASGEWEAASFKEFLSFAILFLFIVIFVGLITYASAAALATTGMNVLP